jgi:hypothetical protein
MATRSAEAREHGHRHGDSERGHEVYSARAHPETVVLDIGGDLGALILHAQADMHGIEIEISPEGEDGNRSHKEVLERRMGERPAFTAVFDRLAAGRYRLWADDTPRMGEVQIRGGEITELDWPGSPPGEEE